MISFLNYSCFLGALFEQNVGFLGFAYGDFISATLLESILLSVARRLSFSSRLFVLCSFLTQNQHKPFLKVISMPIS